MPTAAAEYSVSASSANGPVRFVYNQPLTIRYCNNYGDETTRVIEPLHIYQQYGHTYLRAYCNLRGEVRTFRVDRIITSAPVSPSGYADRGRREEGAVPKTGVPETQYQVHKLKPQYERDLEQTEGENTLSASPASTEPGQKRKRNGGGIVWTILLCGVGILLFLGSDAGVGFWDYVEALTSAGAYNSSYDTLAAAAAKNETESSASSRKDAGTESKPDPSPPVTTKRYQRGYLYYRTEQGERITYSLPSGKTFTSLHALHVHINVRCFREATGTTSTGLEKLYSEADSNRNGYISWDEVERFQRVLVREYRYRSNDTALRPDQFLEQYGGDCEDFALVTAGLLRFWNWQPFIASFAPSVYAPGHAICLVYSDTVPAGFGYYTLKDYYTAEGEHLKDGYYIPIDYEYVGATSNAMEDSWILRKMYVPENIYGVRM